MGKFLLILPLLIVGCATTPPPDPSKDFRATAAAPLGFNKSICAREQATYGVRWTYNF